MKSFYRVRVCRSDARSETCFVILLTAVATSLSATEINHIDCSTVHEQLLLHHGMVTLPMPGKLTIESHLATLDDSFAGHREYPVTVTEGIQGHLARSCQLLLGRVPNAVCEDVYRAWYAGQWTPPEGKPPAKAGQGSAPSRPPAVDEMWSGNMYWTAKSKPRAGTLFLVSYSGRHVAMVMGYETGPTNAKLLVGVQPEVAYSLKATNQSVVTIGRLANQHVKPGPVLCSGEVVTVQ